MNRLAFPFLLLAAVQVSAAQQQASMSDLKQWLESEAPASMRVRVTKGGTLETVSTVEERNVSISDFKLDACALSWTENDVRTTTFVGEDRKSERQFRSSNTVPLEDIQHRFTRADVDRQLGDQPAYLVYMQTSRPTIKVTWSEVVGEGSQPKSDPRAKAYTERSARLLVKTLEDAQRINDAVLKAATMCGARQ